MRRSAGNDHRLGADEAPPAIISVYLGDQLGALVDSIVNGKDYVPSAVVKGSIGVPESPIFPIDSTDRNRTSPFAFTGNKFEFRMLGSSASVADPNIVLNTIVAETFSEAADKLEGSENFAKDCKGLYGQAAESALPRHFQYSTVTAPNGNPKRSAGDCSTIRAPPTPFPNFSDRKT